MNVVINVIVIVVIIDVVSVIVVIIDVVIVEIEVIIIVYDKTFQLFLFSRSYHYCYYCT